MNIGSFPPLSPFLVSDHADSLDLVAAVDCDEDENKNFCGEQGIKGESRT